MIRGRQIRSLLCCLAIAVPSLASAQASFVIFNGGPKSPGDTLVFLYNISHDGRIVVGESMFLGDARHAPGGYAVRSSGASPTWTVHRLATLPTSEIPYSPIYDVAGNRGTLVGVGNTTPDVDVAWSSGLTPPLKPLALYPGDKLGEGRGVNVNGTHVVGWGLTERKSRYDASVPYRHALLWQGETPPVAIDPVGLRASVETVAMATDNSGSAIAGFATTDLSVSHPFEVTDSRGHQGVVWMRKAGSYDRVDLPFLSTQPSCARAYDIDAVGRNAVGFSGTRGTSRPVLWTAQRPGQFQIQDLGVLTGFEAGGANGISPDGETVVGSCYRGGDDNFESTAFIWDRRHGMRDIRKTLLDAGVPDVEPWTLIEASAVSRNGEWVCGNARDADYNIFGWVAHMP